jgi:predicted RNA binding protein YcfA (HicA-like mRNA interferase family)
VSSRDKLIQKILAGNANISFGDARSLLLWLGFAERVKGSHYGFRKEGMANIILKRRPQLLPYQVELIREVLKKHGYKET